MKIKPVSEWVVKSTLEFKWGKQGARIEYSTQGRDAVIDIGVLDKIQSKEYSIRQEEGQLKVYNNKGVEINKLTNKPSIRVEEHILASGMIEPEEIIDLLDRVYKGQGNKAEYTKVKIEEIEENKVFECRHGMWVGYRLGEEIYLDLGFMEIPISYNKSLEIKYLGG